MTNRFIGAALLILAIGIHLTTTLWVASFVQPTITQKIVSCDNCQGTGLSKPPAVWIKYHPTDDREFTCPICDGSGRLIEEIRSQN